MKAGVTKCQKNGLVILLALFLCICALFLRRALLVCVAGAVYFFAGRARGTREGERRPLLFSLCVFSRFLPSSKKEKPAPTTLAYAPLASSDVNVPCIVLHFTVTVCQSQNSSKHLSN